MLFDPLEQLYDILPINRALLKLTADWESEGEVTCEVDSGRITGNPEIISIRLISIDKRQVSIGTAPTGEAGLSRVLSTGAVSIESFELSRRRLPQPQYTAGLEKALMRGLPYLGASGVYQFWWPVQSEREVVFSVLPQVQLQRRKGFTSQRSCGGTSQPDSDALCWRVLAQGHN